MCIVNDEICFNVSDRNEQTSSFVFLPEFVLAGPNRTGKHRKGQAALALCGMPKRRDNTS